ncbi:hypothetical protein T08_6926 [Trichinella sp. T8]|nr:hypothetical protein T08_6926 [Trichinella sp. T8]
MLLLLFLKQTGPSPFNDGLARCQLVEKRRPKRAHAGTTIVDLVTLRSGCNCLSCWPGSAANPENQRHTDDLNTGVGACMHAWQPSPTGLLLLTVHIQRYTQTPMTPALADRTCADGWLLSTLTLFHASSPRRHFYLPSSTGQI